jgi:hypothetical protein
MPLLSRLVRFASSPQGRRAMNQAVRYAQSEKGRARITSARKAVASRRTPPR